MGQMGFFDLANRYGGLDAKNDPLLKIDAVLGWEDFRADLEAVWRKPAAARKSRAGRKPWDAVVMFKAIILCALYNLSDDQVEYQIRDRLSFMRFLGLGLEDRVPDAKTVWLYREQLARAGAIEGLFAAFDGYLKDQGYRIRSVVGGFWYFRLLVYRAHAKTRNLSWVMRLKLSDTWSRNVFHSLGMVSRMNTRTASANCF